MTDQRVVLDQFAFYFSSLVTTSVLHMGCKKERNNKHYNPKRAFGSFEVWIVYMYK